MEQRLVWNALVARLEEDLLARKHFNRMTDDDAWVTAGRLLRVQARIVLSTYSGLQPEDAEDLAQNVLVKLQSLSTMRQLRAARSAQGYIVVMLKNAANDLIRRRQVELKFVGRTVTERSEAMTKFSIAPLERSLVLAEAIDELSEDDRTLLVLRFESGLAIGEIAKFLNLSYAATAARLFRLLQRLRKRV